jgi:hypothetical protein
LWPMAFNSSSSVGAFASFAPTSGAAPVLGHPGSERVPVGA